MENAEGEEASSNQTWTIFVSVAFTTAQSDFLPLPAGPVGNSTMPSSDARGDKAHNTPLANLDVVDGVSLNSVDYLRYCTFFI